MSAQIGAVLDGLVQLETIILHRIKVVHVFEHNSFPVDARLALELQVGLLSVSQLRLNNVARLANLDGCITTTALALAHVGQSPQARQLLGKALEQAKERYVCRFLVADAYAELGENEKAFESIQQAFLQRST